MAFRRSYSNIVNDGKTRLTNTPLNNFNQSGITKAFLDIIAVESEKIYDSIDFVYKAIDPTLAIGSDLDKLGILVGEKRTDSQTASDITNSNFYFFIDPRTNWNVSQLITKNFTSNEIDILEINQYIQKDNNGSIISLIIPSTVNIYNNSQTIIYTPIENAILTNSSNEAYVGIISVDTGPESNIGANVLISHSLHEIPELRKIASFIKCSNRFPIQNGSYNMSDEELRYNISISRNTFNSNEIAVRRAALSVPGVRDILFEKNKYGNGTVNIILDGVSPLISDNLKIAVKEKIQLSMSYGDVIFVDSPKYIGIELNFNIVPDIGLNDPFSLRDIVRNNIIQYINDIPIGGEILWNDIVNIVMSVNGVKDFIPVYFKYGKYDPIYKINKEQIVLRFINQLAKYNEKFYTDSGLITSCISQ